METSGYVGLSAQLALDRRMSSLAQNIANANTAGYRAEVLDFKDVIKATGLLPTDYVIPGGSHVDPSVGGLSQTKNPLDLAVRGSGFFGYQDASGKMVYSRDGRLTLASDGRLMNANGNALTDASGSPLQLDPNIADVSIAADGSILQNGQSRGNVGLFQLNLDGGFSRAPGAAFDPVNPPTPETDFVRNGVVQGYVEESNVNGALAMTSLIQLTRAFEAISQLSERGSDAEKNAIDILGSR
jgi:flagellar basal-body rod protein FlgF